MIRRMKATKRQAELGDEAPMVITPRRLAELVKKVVAAVRPPAKDKA
jgi:hypothetical protein